MMPMDLSALSKGHLNLNDNKEELKLIQYETDRFLMGLPILSPAITDNHQAHLLIHFKKGMYNKHLQEHLTIQINMNATLAAILKGIFPLER
jgi:hypothetical protein